jgi:hypothetical protein
MSQETMKAGLAYRTKSVWMFRSKCSIGNFVTMLKLIRYSMIRCPVMSTENIVENTPMASVTPNPLTGPVPSQIMIAQMQSCVTCASTMVKNALS